MIERITQALDKAPIVECINDMEIIHFAKSYVQHLLDELEKAQREIVDKNEHIRALRIAKEHEIECHENSCFDYQEQIIKKDKYLEKAQKENEALRYRDKIVSLANETLGRYVREGKEEIERLKELAK